MPAALVDVSIVTVAEVPPLVIVTKDNSLPTFWRRTIVGGVFGKVIEECAFSTMSDSVFPFRILIELGTYTLRT